MSIFSDLAEGIQSQLQALTAALAGDSTNGIDEIPTTHVVLRDMHYDATLWEHWRDELSPGWVIGVDKEVLSDPKEGTNKYDDVIYGFVLVGLDREDSRTDWNRTKVWMSRRQAIVQYFHMNNLQALSAGGIRTTLVWSSGQQMYNEQTRKLYHLTQQVIPLRIKVREPRDLTGAA